MKTEELKNLIIALDTEMDAVIKTLVLSPKCISPIATIASRLTYYMKAREEAQKIANKGTPLLDEDEAVINNMKLAIRTLKLFI